VGLEVFSYRRKSTHRKTSGLIVLGLKEFGCVSASIESGKGLNLLFCDKGKNGRYAGTGDKGELGRCLRLLGRR
jgi:hypothetical protein